MIKDLRRNSTSCCNNKSFEFNAFETVITAPFTSERPTFSNSLSRSAFFFSYCFESSSIDVFLVISCTLLA